MSRKQAREYCIAEEGLQACTGCGIPHFIKNLEDHHRDGDPFNNNKDNLTLQCKKCHAKSDVAWRAEKAAGTPIADVRKHEQIGVLVRDLRTGEVSLVYLDGTTRLVSSS